MTVPGERSTLHRVIPVPGGPVLVEGPVEVVLPDASTVVSERPMVALCACRRSNRYPFCDTSHRRKVREAPDQGAGASSRGRRNEERPEDQAPSR